MAQHALMDSDYLEQVFDLTQRTELARKFRGLAADLNHQADQLDPPPADGMCRFDQIPVGAYVKVAGEWHMVVSKSVDHDMFGNRTVERLLLAEDDKPSWWYDLAEGEALPLEQPF